MTRRKFITFVVMAASLAICGWMTKTTQASGETVIMNGLVLGIMILLILAAYFCGIRKVNKIIGDIRQAIVRLDETTGALAPRSKLRDLQFQNLYLKDKYACFLEYQKKVPDAEIEDFINEDEISVSTHRGVWETFADFLTSLGILGTFVGLIIGLQGFSLEDISRISTSVTPLLDGIKVAFLTSVYGISLSLSYSYGLLSAYGDMEEVTDIFLKKFHILWGKEPGNDERVLAEQKQQTEMLRELTETFQEQLASSFAEVITPTIMKLNEQFEVYSDSHQKMLKDTAVQFAEEFRNAFVGGFTQFEKNLEKTNDMQTQYMTFLDHTMQSLSRNIGGQQASIDNYILKSASQQEANMKDVQALIKKMTTSVNSFSKASTGYQDAVAAVADRLFGNEYALMQRIQSFVDAISGFAGELQEKSGKDYSEALAPQNADQSEVLNEILIQMRELVELEKKREHRGLRRLFSGKSR